MTDIESALAAEGIRVTVAPAAGNPALPDQGDGLSHWAVLVEGGGAPVGWHVSTAREDGGTQPPSVDEAVGLLQADLRDLAAAEDPAAWLEGLASGSPDPAWGGALDVLRGVADSIAANLPHGAAAILGAVAVPVAPAHAP